MKKGRYIFILGLLSAIILSGCSSPAGKAQLAEASSSEAYISTTDETIIIASTGTEKSNALYTDGKYSAATNPDGEGYYCKVDMAVEEGMITTFDWYIYDSGNTVFDDKYESHFAGNDEYIQQCRDNLKGIPLFTTCFIKNQGLDGVDSISGATWAFGKFKEAVEAVIKQAESEETEK